MSQEGPVWPGLPRGGERRDKRTREREREREREHAPEGGSAARGRTERAKTAPRAPAAAPPQESAQRPRDPRRDELRVFGLRLPGRLRGAPG